MKGLKLSQLYYEEYQNGLKEILGDDFDKVSVGLCGQGSECFGFDDEISRDHDFGPGFCIFTDDEINKKYGKELKKYYRELPKEFMDVKRLTSAHGRGRVGVLKTKDFYFANLGIDHEPENPAQWYQLSEARLAMITNGKIFHEGDDEFMKLRHTFQGFYPEEVKLKKMASRFAVIAQAGQYNWRRCMMREDYVAAHFALDLFMKNAISAIYLLNDQYMPFYKWAHYGMENLRILRSMKDVFSWLSTANKEMAEIATVNGVVKYDVSVLIETVSGEIVKECVNQGLLQKPVDFLEDGAARMQASIKDELLKKLPLEM